MSVESMFSRVTCCWVRPSGSFVPGGRGMLGILCLVVRGQHGRAAGHALERGIAEIDLALNVDAVVEQRELTLELGRAVPDIALLRFSRAVRAETDIERNVARRDRLLPPVHERFEVGGLVADRPVKLRTDVIDRAAGGSIRASRSTARCRRTGRGCCCRGGSRTCSPRYRPGLTPKESSGSSVCSVSSSEAMSVFTLSRRQLSILLKSAP